MIKSYCKIIVTSLVFQFHKRFNGAHWPHCLDRLLLLAGHQMAPKLNLECLYSVISSLKNHCEKTYSNNLNKKLICWCRYVFSRQWLHHKSDFDVYFPLRLANRTALFTWIAYPGVEFFRVRFQCGEQPSGVLFSLEGRRCILFWPTWFSWYTCFFSRSVML